MKLGHALLLSIPLALAAVTGAHEAAACGACAAPVGEPTQVTGHKMLFSVSPTETTLWDQIEYAGDPTSFAWILPIKGQVDIGLSSDALFALLSDRTATQVYAPPLNCPPPPACWGDWNEAPGGATGGSGGNSDGGGVEVIAHEVVGPYETVQLASSDPAALKNWLISRGYNIDADAAPVIDAYVNEGFDFLAMKLVPGEGVGSMRPVRVSSPGAGNILPLRMVAVGTGPITTMTLWTLGEGRYEPTNFPTFTIPGSDIVWNWDTSESNYATLKDAGFKSGNNGNFLLQYAQPMSPWDIRGTLEQLVSILPDQSGYGDPADGWVTAYDELQEDLGKMFNGLNETSVWLTRANTELARQALVKDLEISASATQDSVSNIYQATKAIGNPPACPQYPPCEPGDPGNDPGDVWWGGFGDGYNSGQPGSTGGGCAVGGTTNSAAALVIAGLGLGISLSRRRRNRR
jgi:hypothetical protein